MSNYLENLLNSSIGSGSSNTGFGGYSTGGYTGGQPSQSTDSGGGDWLDLVSGDNLSGYADAFSTVWDSIKGTSSPDVVNYNYNTEQPSEEENGGTSPLVWVVLAIVVVGAGLYFVKRKGKK